MCWSRTLRKAYDILEAHNWTQEELCQYERMEKINMDMRAREAFIIDKAKEEGREEGIHLVAKNLKTLGMPFEKIAEATGLSLDELSKL